MNGPGSEPICTCSMSTSDLASMPFSFSSLMNSEVLVVGIRPVTIFWPLTSLMLLNLKSGVVAIHTAAPFTTLQMMSTSAPFAAAIAVHRSEEHTSELQSLMRISYAVFCLKKKKYTKPDKQTRHILQ